MRWSSESNQFYAVEQSPSELFPAFTPLHTNLHATPPVNVFTNVITTNAPAAPASFYRLRLQPWPAPRP